ncbi:MAG: serine/threonine protein kinase [Polyangiaceae bacterium]|nr:serine/threonine protein kinase [Polyangiaceae bacterium]
MRGLPGHGTASSNAPSDAQLPQPGDVIADKYRVESVVGTGGMGVVFAARHMQLDQCVAIKVLMLPASDERRSEAVVRFLREGRAAAALRSDHVVRIHDVGSLDSGMPYMVMELLTGCDLASLLSHLETLPVEHAVECVLQAGDAIAQAHQQGIIHRDLKPSNLFVTTRSDGSTLIKVLDFGISKSLQDRQIEGELTDTRTVLGSPFYMSPEQVRGAKHVDHRTDIWSLGAILHEALSGRPPFEADTLPAACAAIVADAPRSLRPTRADVPERLEAIVLRCLQKDPSQRYACVDDLLRALRPFSACGSGRPAPRFEGPPSLLRDTGAEDACPSLDAIPGTVTAASTTLMAESGHDAANAASGARSHARLRAGTEDQGATAATVSLLSKSGRWWVVLGACVAVVGAGLWLGRSKPNSGGARAPVAHPLTSARPAPDFTLLLESSPSGAEVYEDNGRLGTTPLALKVGGATVEAAPRSFELRLNGFETYVLRQGAAHQDVRQHAVLVAQKTRPPAPPPVPTASAEPPATTRRDKPHRAPPRQAPGPTPSAPVDIRLNR